MEVLLAELLCVSVLEAVVVRDVEADLVDVIVCTPVLDKDEDAVTDLDSVVERVCEELCVALLVAVIVLLELAEVVPDLDIVVVFEEIPVALDVIVSRELFVELELFVEDLEDEELLVELLDAVPVLEDVTVKLKAAEIEDVLEAEALRVNVAETDEDLVEDEEIEEERVDEPVLLVEGLPVAVLEDDAETVILELVVEVLDAVLDLLAKADTEEVLDRTADFVDERL